MNKRQKKKRLKKQMTGVFVEWDEWPFPKRMFSSLLKHLENGKFVTVSSPVDPSS